MSVAGAHHAKFLAKRQMINQVISGQGFATEIARAQADSLDKTMAVERAASDATGGIPNTDALRANLGNVERFLVKEGLHLPPEELAERLSLHLSNTTMADDETLVDRAVRSAIIAPQNVYTSIDAVKHLFTTGQIDQRVAAALFQWFTLMRSGTF